VNSSRKEHDALVRRILRDLGTLPDVILEQRMPIRHALLPNGAPVSTGTIGEADIQGVIGPHGRLVALEVKTGDARRTPEQIAWAQSRERLGCVVAVVHSVEEARVVIEQARAK
jgi:hypothetical protein